MSAATISPFRVAAHNMTHAQNLLNACHQNFAHITDQRLQKYLTKIRTQLFTAGRHLQRAGGKNPQTLGKWKVLNNSRKLLKQKLAARIASRQLDAPSPSSWRPHAYTRLERQAAALEIAAGGALGETEEVAIPVPAYSSQLGEFGCNLGTVAYVPEGAEGVHPQLCGSPGMATFTGLCSISFGAKEANRNIIEFCNAYNRKDAEQMVMTGAKVIAFSNWILNGLASIAFAVSTVFSKTKEALKSLANFGPIAGMIAAGTLMLCDIKDLVTLLRAETIDWGQVKEKLLSLLANVCMFVAPLLMFVLAASQPQVAFALILALGIVSVVAHVAREWEWFKTHKAQGALYIAVMIAALLIPIPGNITSLTT